MTNQETRKIQNPQSYVLLYVYLNTLQNTNNERSSTPLPVFMYSYDPQDTHEL